MRRFWFAMVVLGTPVFAAEPTPPSQLRVELEAGSADYRNAAVDLAIGMSAHLALTGFLAVARTSGGDIRILEPGMSLELSPVVTLVPTATFRDGPNSLRAFGLRLATEIRLADRGGQSPRLSFTANAQRLRFQGRFVARDLGQLSLGADLRWPLSEVFAVTARYQRTGYSQPAGTLREFSARGERYFPVTTALVAGFPVQVAGVDAEIFLGDWEFLFAPSLSETVDSPDWIPAALLRLRRLLGESWSVGARFSGAFPSSEAALWTGGLEGTFYW